MPVQVAVVEALDRRHRCSETANVAAARREWTTPTGVTVGAGLERGPRDAVDERRPARRRPIAPTRRRRRARRGCVHGRGGRTCAVHVAPVAALRDARRAVGDRPGDACLERPTAGTAHRLRRRHGRRPAGAAIGRCGTRRSPCRARTSPLVEEPHGDRHRPSTTVGIGDRGPRRAVRRRCSGGRRPRRRATRRVGAEPLTDWTSARSPSSSAPPRVEHAACGRRPRTCRRRAVADVADVAVDAGQRGAQRRAVGRAAGTAWLRPGEQRAGRRVHSCSALGARRGKPSRHRRPTPVPAAASWWSSSSSCSSSSWCVVVVVVGPGGRRGRRRPGRGRHAWHGHDGAPGRDRRPAGHRVDRVVVERVVDGVVGLVRRRRRSPPRRWGGSHRRTGRSRRRRWSTDRCRSAA